MSKKKKKSKTGSSPLSSLSNNYSNKYDAEINNPKIDFDNPKDLKFLEKQFFDFCKQTQKSLPLESRSSLEHLDYTKAHLKKRCKAFLSYVKEASEHFKEKYPNLFIEESFANFNASVLDNYDMCAALHHIDFAIALWILDELRSAHLFNDALEYFPEESEIDISIIGYHDASHESKAIRSILFLMKHRNSPNVDEKMFVSKVELDSTSKRQYQTPDNSKDLSYRERFDAIIALIPKEHIENAVKQFKDKSWEYLDIILNGANKYREKEIKCLRKLKRFTQEIEEKAKSQTVNFKNPTVMDNISPFSFDEPIDSPFDVLGKLKDAADIENELNEYYTKRDMVTVLGNSMQLRIEYCNDNPEDEVSKLLCDFEVDNPYEACFAAFYMLDSGDDFAWLYGFGMGILQTAILQLPWGRVSNLAQMINFDEYSKEMDALENPNETQVEASEINDDNQSPKEQTNEKSISDIIATESEEFDTDLYKKVYNDSSYTEGFDINPNEFISKANFPQIVFEETGVVIPRTTTLVSRKPFYKKLNNSDDIYKHYLNLVQASPMREGETIIYDDEDFDDDIIQRNLQATVPEANNELKKEKEEFRRKVIAFHNERNELKREIRLLQKANDDLNRELTELRSMILERKEFTSNSNQADKHNEPIVFPYEAKHRFVVFGGHATWAKAIKPLLKNVRFIDAYAKPNTSLILHADAVWLQSNAIGHSSYYKIMNLVREHGVPLQYFEAASAEKCAEQLAQYDLSLT